ncbi:uncharacterized protein ALTATR162_LOCUS4950 [Alternaria atra]|uniref:Uncharacterized protein n=1 Tax=Alternaria atra TaxID=119953 RepID=A0A8J2I252_9PLEO|nr:uncharacterized protein ALTATR162_LOCUS4950 [Alternaria atra]CAG5157158.1 unnamed protein product [Alternaria atra]
MADLPPHIPDYATINSTITEKFLSSLPPLPPSPPRPRPTEPRRRAPSPPAPPIYVTGYSCIASDPEYEYARHITGDTQPYWFEESYGPADFNDGVRRRARKYMTLLENEVAIIDLGDIGNEMDRVTARDQRERARERALLGPEPVWELEEDKVSINAAIHGSTGLLQDTKRLVREKEKLKEGKKMREEEKEKLKAGGIEEMQKNKDESRASRIPIRDHALSLLDFTKKAKTKGKSKAEISESQSEVTESQSEVVQIQHGVIEPQPEAAKESEKEYHPLTVEKLPKLPSPPTDDPAPIPTLRTLEELLELPATPRHDPAATPSPTTTPTTTDTDSQSGSTPLTSRPRLSSAAQVQAEVQSLPNPNNTV